MSCNFFQPVSDECIFIEDVRYLNSEINQNERELQSRWFLEEISQFGTNIEYIQCNYSTENHNSIYGEHTTKQFGEPHNMIMFVLMNQDSIILSQYGIESDADITAFVHISSFYEEFGEGSEPIAGDLIKLTEYGNTDRPNGRGPATFEVTRRDDEDLQQINPLLGHYVWLIRGKRHDFSYENNVTPEPRMNQVNDDLAVYTGVTPESLNEFDGDDITTFDDEDVVEISNNDVSDETIDNIEKPYDQNSDGLGKEIFDYDEFSKSNDSVYGDY